MRATPLVRTSIPLSESWAFFPAQTSDLRAANSQPMPPRRGKVFSLPAATRAKLKFLACLHQRLMQTLTHPELDQETHQ